jgi:hypothetical protein
VAEEFLAALPPQSDIAREVGKLDVNAGVGDLRPLE